MSNYSFIEATIDDLPVIIQWTEALMAHESLDKKIELPLVDNIVDKLTDWLTNLIADDNSLIIIAIDELKKPQGIIIGYLQLQPNEFTLLKMHGVIQMVWVEKNIRKKGLARQLVIHMENTFKNLHIHYCEIQYSDSNIEAKEFWNKLDYQLVSHSCRKFL